MAEENLPSRGRETELKFILIEILRVKRSPSIKNHKDEVVRITIDQHLLFIISKQT
jgi:hypothetical protein